MTRFVTGNRLIEFGSGAGFAAIQTIITIRQRIDQIPAIGPGWSTERIRKSREYKASFRG
jgi:hypothetical protein